MSQRYLGNNGALYLDVSEGATGTTLTKIPFTTEIAPNQERPDIDVTAMGDSGDTNLKDFPKFRLQVTAFDDQDSNALQIAADGQDRLFLWVFDETATTKKGGYTTGQVSWSPTARVRQGVQGTLSLTSSSGSITDFFQASVPDPT